jgi:O-antigen/teichoic acid export membrane protein
MAFRALVRLRRLSATALGTYVATAIGFFISVVATHALGVGGYARFATVLAAVSFLQMLLDLTVEEALVKYGFRYATAQDWGRFRRLFELALAYKVVGGLLGTVSIAILAAFASSIWSGQHLAWPLLIGAFVPLAQSIEGVAAGTLILRRRYDLRAHFSALAMALRVVGIGVGSIWGVGGAVGGMLVAQVIASAAIGTAGLAAFRRFPAGDRSRLGDDGVAFRRFVISSTIGSGLVSARSQIGTPLIGVVAPFTQAGYFRNAQAPLTGMAALSTPARLVLLTDQTSDFERGRHDLVLRNIRRYAIGSTAIMAVVVPLLWLLMPWLLGIAYGGPYREHAAQAARILLFAGALQLIFAWTDTLPITLGRPGLRIAAHVLELIVFVPLLLVLGARWGATGAAVAMLVSTAAFCALWVVLILRLRHDLHRPLLRRAVEAA